MDESVTKCDEHTILSYIQWDHIDGPVFHGKDGYIHWLTLLEKLMFRCGAMTIGDLERKYNFEPCKEG